MQLKTWKITGLKIFIPSIVILALIVFYLVIKSYVDMFGTVRINSAEAWGQFGDFVGGLTNPILSFLGLIVLLQSFRYQLDSSQRQLTVSEVEKFENTFFKLVERVESQSEYLFRDPEKPKAISAFRKKLLARKPVLDELPWPDGLAESRAHVRSIVNKDSDRINSFVDKISQCIKFVARSKLNRSEKEFYFDYLIQCFHKYEYTVYLAIVFCRSPETVMLIREYRLSSKLKEHAFVSKHVMGLYRDRPVDGAYPFSDPKQTDEDIKASDL